MTTYLMDKEGKFIPATQRPDGTWRKARRVKEGYVPQEEVPLYESKGKKISERRAAMYPPGYTPNCVDPLKKERDDLIKAKAMKQSPPIITIASSKTAAATTTTASATITTVANGPKINKKPNTINQKNVTKSAQGTKTVAATAAGTTLNAKSKKATKASNKNNSSSSSSKTVITNNNNNNNNNNSNDYNNIALDDLTESLGTIDINDAQSVSKQLKKLRKKMREIETIEEKLESGELKKPEMDQMAKVKRKAEIQEDINRLIAADLRLAGDTLTATTTNHVPPTLFLDTSSGVGNDGNATQR